MHILIKDNIRKKSAKKNNKNVTIRGNTSIQKNMK